MVGRDTAGLLLGGVVRSVEVVLGRGRSEGGVSGSGLARFAPGEEGVGYNGGPGDCEEDKEK